MAAGGHLIVRLSDGSKLAVPASLDSMTTYVLLEQDSWFEKEPSFVLNWLRPGMTAIDIGANAGVYAIPMARAVGPHGHVFAYEPAAEPRALLETSRAINGAQHLTIVPAALSDAPGQARLGPASSSELHSLASEGSGEEVRVTSLDCEERERRWGAPDFVKIDAEGQELNIVSGGRKFFARHSPVVMFEVKAGDVESSRVRAAFVGLGYRIFRLIYGAPLLVPVASAEAVDPYEFNLFAIKHARASALARERSLVESVVEWSPSEAALAGALHLLMAQPFGPVLTGFLIAPLDPDYRAGLAAYAQWRDAGADPAIRYGALRCALRSLQALCERAPLPGRLSTLARVAWEAGERKSCTAALRAMMRAIRENRPLSEPFWPASPRYDAIAPGARLGPWFVDAAMEQMERATNHSSFFVKEGVDLEWLAREPFISTEMERRRVLKRLRRGERMAVPERLMRDAPDHINAELWRSGAIPNTLPAAT